MSKANSKRKLRLGVLNLDKNQILNTFTGIKGLSEKIQKPYKFVKKFVDSIYDGFYYLRISQCPNNILNIYTKPIKEHFTKKLFKLIHQLNKKLYIKVLIMFV